MDTDVPPILLPCAICARTFMPQSLEKHARICERSANKKRKPFDSAKQRIQGTELAEFLPRQEKKRRSPEEKSSKSWKQTHDDFLRAIRAARNEIVDSTMQKQCSTTITSSAPTRANEQGMCPTCNRHFGVKAYDRHVAWCKERIARVPVSPATNIAKERLEARMKYRAPAVKSRRQATREKYSPGSAITLSAGNKMSPGLVPNKAKESASAPSCNNKSNDSPVKQKTTLVRRSNPMKESTSTIPPMKSRLPDRTNRQLEDDAGPSTFRPAPPVKRISHLPVPPLKAHKRESFDEWNGNNNNNTAPPVSPRSCNKRREGTRKSLVRARQDGEQMASNGQKTGARQQDEKHQQTLHSARSLKMNIVSARSQGNPKVNDVSINDDIVGITVKPCNIYGINNQLTTWKQIAETDQTKILISRQCEDEDLLLPSTGNEKRATRTDNDNDEDAASKEKEEDGARKLSSRSESMNWSSTTTTLNQTYSFREAGARVCDDRSTGARSRRWRPVRHSPRVEFCLKEPVKVNQIYVSSLFSGEKGNRCHGDPSSEERRGGEERLAATKQESNRYFENSSNFNSSARSNNKIFEKKGSTGGYTDNEEEEEDEEEEEEEEEDDDSENDNFEMLNSASRSLRGKKVDVDALSAGAAAKRRGNPLDYEVGGAIEANIEANENSSLFEKNLIASISYEFTDLNEYDDFTEKERDKNRAGEEQDEEEEEEEDSRLYDDERASYEDRSCKEIGKNCVESEKTNEGLFKSEETNWIEMETEPSFLTEIILQPSRSSTPFVSFEARSPKERYDEGEYEVNAKENSMEWKVEIDTETGSEVLYRVENNSGDSNRSSSREEGSSRPVERDFARFPSTLQNERKTPFSEGATSPSLRRKEEKTVRSPIAYPPEKDERVIFPKRKEIGNQINICDCSKEISPNNWSKCEKGVGECSIADTNAENRELARDVQDAILENCGARRTNNSENNFNSDVIESSTSQLNANLETDDIAMKDADSLRNNMEEEEEEENEEVQEIYSAKDFDCDSDNSVENQVQEPTNETKCSKKRTEEKTRQTLPSLRSIILSESCVKLSQRVQMEDSNRSTALKSRRSRRVEIENRIHQENVETVEVETIEEIGTRNRSIKFRILPEIKGTGVLAKRSYDDKERSDPQTYWEKASKATRNRLINLDPPYQGASRFLKRNPKVHILPPVPSSSSLVNRRNIKLPLHPVWSNYVRRRPDFNLLLSSRTGKDYDPFLLAEQQMNDLLSDTSEQSVADSCPSIDQNSRQKSFPLSHSSAFVKYPCQSSPNAGHEKRSSSIPAPPTELDDITSDFSSDSTETNSLSRELFSLKDEKERAKNCRGTNPERRSPVKELGRRVIIDKSRALGGDELVEEGNKSVAGEARKIAEPRASVKMIRPVVDRSPSVRASSAPKAGQERGKNPASKIHSHDENALPSRKNKNSNGRNNNYPLNLSSSNLSLSSIISSDVDMKRSNSVFDELMTSFEEDENGAFVPSLKSLLKTDSLSSPVHASRHRNGRISDEELSSPESYKRQDHNKMSGDSAYSSLNRKYSHHGRSTNDVAGRFDEDTSRSNRRDGDGGGGIHVVKCKMSKYCHQCGFKFPETAKFCCECGIRRLVL
ncbi:uncharacterized protein LOC724652 isoform X5 [Apis mellifera]|uniref:Uncharacterized protein LOC724652 isoform X5 n=1 Tax=Apis mellifera TaxID=7460 RepID=A0A7M7IN53_APIME|nr:uncharacterized protein LOC724652 isoform X5 [Apis mellifera]|eukprot:XP_016766576.2 uncharacterized protein LOC724652 isoform X5 [Apis mellifera]